MEKAHLSALASKHTDIDRRIAEETRRPSPDATTLSRLKKEKLKLKEELSGL